MPNLPPHLRNLPPEPAPAAPVDKFAMPPDPSYDQSSHQLGMARPYQRPSYANVMQRFASRLSSDTGVQDY